MLPRADWLLAGDQVASVGGGWTLAKHATMGLSISCGIFSANEIGADLGSLEPALEPLIPMRGHASRKVKYAG
jgi:hypothetical protein